MSDTEKKASQKDWKTSITSNKEGEILVRGYNIDSLIGNLTFAQTAFLVLKGELPNEKEAKMMDAILVSCVDAGIAPPSVVAARTVFSGGNPLNAAVAAGVLTLGDAHGGAIEQCAKIFQDLVKPDVSDVKALAKQVVTDFLAKKKRFPGYGHKIHKVDPRTTRMLEVAKELGFGGKYIDFAVAVQKEYAEQKPDAILPLNVDGCIAAIISDMGFDWKLGKGFFIIARTVGLVAHVHEEWVREKPFRRLPMSLHEYDGVAERKLK